MRRAASALAAIGGFLLAFLCSAAGASPVLAATSVLNPGPASSLPDSLELLASATPKTVVLDPSTGAVASISVGEPTETNTLAVPEISSDTSCGAGDGCYYTPVVDSTYHDRSFYGGPGTFFGYWPRRNAWTTGRYTAYACWESACSQSFGPNTYLTFGGSLVTGTSFTIL